MSGEKDREKGTRGKPATFKGRLLSGINSLSDVSGKIVSYLVWIGAIMLSWEVVSRYCFGAPTVWAHGYSQRLFGSYFVLVGAFTLQRGYHVRVDLLTNMFSSAIRRFFDLVNMAFLILWSGVLIKEGWVFFWNSWTIKEVDEMVLAHPVYPYKFVLLVGALLIFLQAVATIIGLIASKGREERA
jgi:TRAP-type mannitol/chloroaromatic compound transport system permease small subunit